jgi:hypothetical protein
MAQMQQTAENIRRRTSAEAGWEGPAPFGKEAIGTQASEQNDLAAQVQAMFLQASSTNNVAMRDYLANFIAGNTTVQNALLTAGTNVGLSFEGLAGILKEKSADLAKQFTEKGKTTGTPPPTHLMGGGNTINIKQDFRDQDPDRIAIMFQRDLTRAVLAKTVAAGAMG